MLSLTRRSLVLALAAALASCAPAEPVRDSAADQAAIDTVRSEWQAAFNAGDVARLMTLYTSGAVRLPANQPAQIGLTAIEAALDAQMSQMTANAAVTADETVIMGEWAFDRGSYTTTVTPMDEGAAPMTESGRYLVILRRQVDGAWLIAREMDNASEPPADMAMPGMDSMSTDDGR